MEKNFECKVVQGVSKKTGNAYVALDIKLTPNYSKRVFLDPAEQALVMIDKI